MDVPEQLLAELVRQAVAEALRTAPVPTLRPGESRGGDPTLGTAQVVLDGDDVEITFQCLVPVPSRGVRVMVMLQPPSSGVVVGYVNGGQMLPTGSLLGFGGLTPPGGWLLCDGASLSKVQHAGLYAVLGVRFGGTLAGTTFQVPDLRGRVLAGIDAGSARLGAGYDTIGEAGGTESHVVTVAEMPSHRHGLSEFRFTAGGTNTLRALIDGTGAGVSQLTDFAGSGNAFSLMQPTLAAQWIVKA